MSDTLKETVENAKTEQLLSLMEVAADMVFIGHGDPNKNEPDVLYKRKPDNKIIGIEVAGAYYEDSDAKQAWELARGNIKIPEGDFLWRDGGYLKNPQLIIGERILNELVDKANKTYFGCDEYWLCIFLHAALSTKFKVEQELNIFIQDKVIPESNFDRTFILAYDPRLGDYCLEIKNDSYLSYIND